MATFLFVKTADTSQALLLPVNLKSKLKHLFTVIQDEFPVNVHAYLVLYHLPFNHEITGIELVFNVFCHEGHAGFLHRLFQREAFRCS